MYIYRAKTMFVNKNLRYKVIRMRGLITSAYFAPTVDGLDTYLTPY